MTRCSPAPWLAPRFVLPLAALILLSACAPETQGTAGETASRDSAGTTNVSPVLSVTETNDDQSPQSRVTVIHGGLIHTMEPGQLGASAMAFDGSGLILAVGEDLDTLAAYPQAERIDLAGRTVIPGMIDSHGHLHGLAESMTRADLMGTVSLEDVIDRLKQHEAALGEEDWLLGRGWDQNDWPGQTFPSRQDLDEHFPDRPVWLRRIDGHAAWGNSAALARADRDLSGDWQVEGGMIHRDVDGQPTGIFIDKAMTFVESVVPPTSDTVMMEAIDLALRELLRLGLTGVHDPGLSREAVSRFQRKLDQGLLHTRLYAMTDGAGDTLEWLCERGPIEDPSGRLFMRSTKLYGDGALGSRGAALLTDYSDDPGNRGLLFLEAGAMKQQLDKVLACGFQAGVHAIGDRANRVVIDALEASMAGHPDNPGRHRVEHAQVLTAKDLDRFADLGIIAAMQPTHATSDMYWAEDRVGSRRIRFAYAWRSLLDSGASVAFGSDFPVEAVDPRHGLYAAVSRMDLAGTPEVGWYPEERVTREEALRGFTLDAAYAGFMEEMVGSLAVGKRADFVVLDRDYMTIPLEEIPEMKILETWLDGIRLHPR
ncbi:MAG: amidohydrolase [Pseudomonadota bacterium]